MPCREYFQLKFFPSVWEAEYGPNKVVTTSPYCKFDSQTLQLFQSSLYIAGELLPSAVCFLHSAIAGQTCTKLPRHVKETLEMPVTEL